MPRLNNDQSNQVIGMLWAGTDVDQVVGAFGFHRTTISRLRDKFTGSVKEQAQAWSAKKVNCTK